MVKEETLIVQDLEQTMTDEVQDSSVTPRPLPVTNNKPPPVIVVATNNKGSRFAKPNSNNKVVKQPVAAAAVGVFDRLTTGDRLNRPITSNNSKASNKILTVKSAVPPAVANNIIKRNSVISNPPAATDPVALLPHQLPLPATELVSASVTLLDVTDNGSNQSSINDDAIDQLPTLPPQTDNIITSSNDAIVINKKSMPSSPTVMTKMVVVATSSSNHHRKSWVNRRTSRERKRENVVSHTNCCRHHFLYR
jgi:hypothetical protein